MSTGGPTITWWIDELCVLVNIVLTDTQNNAATPFNLSNNGSFSANYHIKRPAPPELRTRNTQWKLNQQRHGR